MSSRPCPLDILVIDDEVNIRKMLVTWLETDGNRVVAVSNGQDALSEAARRPSIWRSSIFVLAQSGESISSLHAWERVTGEGCRHYCAWSIDSAAEMIPRGATDYAPREVRRRRQPL